METTPLISILIPIYNGEFFLEKTMQSIQEQSFKNYEVICIDDNSTDRSFEYLHSLAKKDSRIKVIKRKNKGGNASKGISYGLPYCKGKYFFYMSQDDFISSDCLKKCFDRIEETQADICIPDTVVFTGVAHLDPVMKAPDDDYNQLMSGKEAFYQSIIYKISGFALRKLSLVQKIGQDDKYYDSCDKSMAFQYFYANKVAFCDARFFYRQNNPNAITKVFSIQNLHHLDTCNEVLKFSIENKVKHQYLKKMVSTFLKRRKSLMAKSLNLPKEKKYEADEIFNKSLFEMRKILFKHLLLNLFFKTILFSYSKNILRINFFNYLSLHDMTNNILYKKIEKKLVNKNLLFNAYKAKEEKK